jgi:hypothetical protein
MRLAFYAFSLLVVNGPCLSEYVSFCHVEFTLKLRWGLDKSTQTCYDFAMESAAGWMSGARSDEKQEKTLTYLQRRYEPCRTYITADGFAECGRPAKIGNGARCELHPLRRIWPTDENGGKPMTKTEAVAKHTPCKHDLIKALRPCPDCHAKNNNVAYVPAALCLAAPELLEAARYAVQAYSDDLEAYPVSFQTYINGLEAAIAKAEGK